MNTTDFKLWFKGLTAGLPEGVSLSVAQFKALKEAVEGLGEDPILKEPSPDKSPAPAQTTPDIDVWMEVLKKKMEETSPKTSPGLWPNRDWGPYYHDPLFPHSTYPDIWCSTSGPNSDVMSLLHNYVEGLNIKSRDH